MGAGSDEARALATLERVIGALRALEERDEAIERLLAALEDDRAHLLAAVIAGQSVARRPARVRREVGGP